MAAREREDEERPTPAMEAVLRGQAIGYEGPGTILRDFGIMLQFIRERGGVKVAGKQRLFPIALLEELNARLSHPLPVRMKRPQLRSFPNIQGLFLLLRSTQLAVVEGAGEKARMTLDEELLAAWGALNPVEQYFNLLEAWLLGGSAEMIGMPGDSLLGDLLGTLQDLSSRPLRYGKSPMDRPWVLHDAYQIALAWMFGWVEIEQGPEPAEQWRPTRIRRTPFGEAMAAVISADRLRWILDRDLMGPDDEDEAAESGSEDQGSEDEAGDDEASEDAFGRWQELFRPYFPQWEKNLPMPAVEFRDGVYVFKVSLGQVWRRIALPAEHTLDDLAAWILKAYRFDSDHLYQFTFRGRSGEEVRADGPEPADDYATWDIELGGLPLTVGDTMEFLYDWGDSWRFTLKLDRIEPPGRRTKPSIIEQHGKAPPQYRWD